MDRLAIQHSNTSQDGDRYAPIGGIGSLLNERSISSAITIGCDGRAGRGV